MFEKPDIFFKKIDFRMVASCAIHCSMSKVKIPLRILGMDSDHRQDQSVKSLQ